MSRTVINPDTVFNSVQYGFSQAVVVTGSRRMLLSGQVGIDVHERTVGPGLQEQTEAALDNIERVLAAGGRIDQVIMLRIYICETAREDQEVIAQALRERFVGSAAVVVDRRQRPVVAGMADRDRSRGHAGPEGVGGGSAMPLALAEAAPRGLVAPGARRRPLSDTREIPPCEPADPGAISPAPPLAGGSAHPASSGTSLRRTWSATSHSERATMPWPSSAHCSAAAPVLLESTGAIRTPTAGPPPFLKRHRVTSSSFSRSAMQSCSRRSSSSRRAVTRQISGRGAEDAAVRRQRIGHQRGVAQLADVHHYVPVVAGQPRRTVGQRQAGRDARCAGGTARSGRRCGVARNPAAPPADGRPPCRGGPPARRPGH